MAKKEEKTVKKEVKTTHRAGFDPKATKIPSWVVDRAVLGAKYGINKREFLKAWASAERRYTAHKKAALSQQKEG